MSKVLFCSCCQNNKRENSRNIHLCNCFVKRMLLSTCQEDHHLDSHHGHLYLSIKENEDRSFWLCCCHLDWPDRITSVQLAQTYLSKHCQGAVGQAGLPGYTLTVTFVRSVHSSSHRCPFIHEYCKSRSTGNVSALCFRLRHGRFLVPCTDKNTCISISKPIS